MSQLLLGAEAADGIGTSTPQLPLAPGSKFFGFSNPTDDLISERPRLMEEEVRAEERKAKTSYWEGFKKAWQQNSGWVFEGSGLTQDLIDPDYKHDMEKHRAMLKEAGALPEHYDYFNQPIFSEAHARLLIDRYKKSRENDQYMADMGVGGSLAVNLAAGIADPVGLAIGVGTGGLAYAYKAYKVGKMVQNGVAAARAAEEVAKASKLAGTAKAAAVGAGTNMATELVLSQYKPTWQSDDLLWAGAFGGAFGGAGHYIGASLKAGSNAHLNSPDFGDENRAIHSIGDAVEVGAIREDVKRGEYTVAPEIEKIINDPLQTDPVGTIGKLAGEAETRIKELEDQIAKMEAEIKATEVPTQDTPLVSVTRQVKNPATDVKMNLESMLPEKARLALAELQPGGVYSDIRAAPAPKGNANIKKERSTRRVALNEFASQLMKDFLPDQRMYLTSSNGAIPSRAVKNVHGVTMRLSNDSFQVTMPVKSLTSDDAYSTLAHEIGHQVVNVHFDRAPTGVRRAIYEEYQNYLRYVKDEKDGKKVMHSRFTADGADEATLVTKNPAEELAGLYRDRNYIFSFDEYMAERFAKYVQQRDDLSLPETVRQYFDALMEKLKALFGKVEGYLKPGTTVEQFFEDVRAGRYKDAPKRTQKDREMEASKLAGEVEKLKEQLGITQESLTSYNNFLRSDTAAALAQTAPEAVMGNVRFDISGSLMTSPNPIVRRLGSLFVNEAVGLKNGAVQRMTAEEGQKILQRQFEVQFYRDFTPMFDQWLDKQKLTLRERWNARARFSDEVGRTILGIEKNPSPEAKKMADTYSRLMVEYNQHINDIGKLEGKQLGGLRADPVPDDPGYFTRLHDMMKWHEFVARHGVDKAEEFFKGSMMKANPFLSDELAGKIAKTYVKKVRGMELEEYSGFDRAFSGQDLDELRKILDEQGLLTKDEIDNVIFELRANTGKDHDSPANSRMKRRAMLDTSHEMLIGNERITIADFINTNAEEVFTTYNRQMSGAISMARVGVRTKADFDRLVLQIADSAKAIPGYADSYRMKTDLANLEFAYKRIMGIPTNEDTALTRVAGMLQKYNLIRLMNQMGLAQFQELGNILGQMGLKTALKSVPTLRTFIRDVQSGKLNDAVMDELEIVLGHGTDILKGHNITERWMDEVGGYMNPATNRVMNSIDTALNKGINATMMVSGFRAVNVLLQRWVSRALAQKFTDAAFGSDKVIKAEFRQMMGMDDAMYKRVLGQLKKHSKVEDGALFGRKIKAINLNQWDDAGAAAAFTTGIFRWSRRMVQENDVGSMHRWMGHTAGQLVFQFRSFVLNAWSKNTLWAVHNRNTEMLNSLLWGTTMAAIVYTGRLYVNSIGREDREEYLEKHLSLDKIVVNGISRTAQASLLPGLIDSTVAPMFGAQLFSESRTTGLSAGAGPFTDALSNPTLDLLNKMGNAPNLFGDTVLGEKDQSAAAIRRNLSMLPWQNAIGVQQGLNVLSSAIAE